MRFLELKADLTIGLKNRLGDVDACEKEDFDTLTKNLVNGGTQKEYIIKLDTAKEMAMLERNEKRKASTQIFHSGRKEIQSGISCHTRTLTAVTGHDQLGNRAEASGREA